MELAPIRDRAQIVHHLESVIQAQIHLTVSLEGTEEDFLTQAVALESEGRNRQVVILDEITPRHGQIRARQSRSIRLAYRLGHEPFFFEAPIRRLQEEPFPSVVVDVPSEIIPNQLRRHYRVEPFTDEPVTLTAIQVAGQEEEPEREAKRCVVFDISIGGIAFNTSIPRSRLEPGSQIPRISLVLPTGDDIHARAIARSVRPTQTGIYRHRVGAEFFMLDERSRDRIARYVTEKQRADIKRIKREFE